MCDSVDENITSQLYKVGGAKYTTISSLAWRLVFGLACTASSNQLLCNNDSVMGCMSP